MSVLDSFLLPAMMGGRPGCNGAKRTIYLLAFIVLGILAQFVVHAWIEIWYIGLLLKDFPRYGLGFSWDEWLMIHHVGSVLLFIAGALAGFGQGKYWWQKIYVEKRLERWLPWLKV